MSRREAVEVVVDRRGHISSGELVFADLGPTLEVWAYQGATLYPRQARDLGAALVAWAERKQPGVEDGAA